MAIDDGRVVSNFINQAIHENDITINGDGKQTRSFQYIDDLIDGMILMMNSSDDFIGPVNIGNPNEITINKLASLVLGLTGSSSDIIYKNLTEDDPKRRNPDIERAQTKLNWQPKYKLERGLINTINYFNQIYEKN